MSALLDDFTPATLTTMLLPQDIEAAHPLLCPLHIDACPVSGAF